MPRTRILIALLAIVVLLAGTLAVVAMAEPTTAPDLSYPPNSRQLVAAGLAARPPRGSITRPAAVDLVLADGIQTTVLYHLPGTGRLGLHAGIPLITRGPVNMVAWRMPGTAAPGHPRPDRGRRRVPCDRGRRV